MSLYYEMVCCPICGYGTSEILFMMSMADPACPRCGASKLSEFIPNPQLSKEQPEGTEAEG